MKPIVIIAMVFVLLFPISISAEVFQNHGNIKSLDNVKIIFDNCINDKIWMGHVEDSSGNLINDALVTLMSEFNPKLKQFHVGNNGEFAFSPQGNSAYSKVDSVRIIVNSESPVFIDNPKCIDPKTVKGIIIGNTKLSQIESETLSSTTLRVAPPLMISTENDVMGTSIKSTNSYVDQYGYAHIIGEFVNNQDKTLNFVKFIATLYDVSGNVLDTEFAYSIIDVVHPYTKTPFEITVSGNVDMISKYEVQSSVSQSSPLPQKLELSPVRVFEDEYGYHHVVGEVSNTGESTAHFVKIISSFYDKNDDLVGVGWAYTTLDNIYPNGKSPFEIIISDFISTNGYSFQKVYDSYSLFVTSQEYDLMYELPSHVKIISNDKDENNSFGFATQQNSDNGGGCLIATATYGSELALEVQQLRELRDNQLLNTESGTNFMNSFNNFYYLFSPVIADYEREHPIFREAVKVAITPMISSLSILNYVDMDSESSVLGYGISLIILNGLMYVGIPASVVVVVRRF